MMPGGLKREKGVNVRLVVVAGGISGSVFWGEIKYSSADLYKRGFTEVVCDPAPVQHQKKKNCELPLFLKIGNRPKMDQSWIS